MQKERLAEYLERYHLGASNAATSRELECVFSIKGIEVRQRVLLRHYGTGGAGNHRPSDTADQRDRRRHQRTEPIPGTVQYRTDPAAAGRR